MSTKPRSSRSTATARATAGKASAGRKAARPESSEATAGVVLLALLRVGEHVVRRLHLLEAFLVAGIPVGMHFADKLSVRLLELVGRRVLRHAERLVEAARASHRLRRR